MMEIIMEHIHQYNVNNNLHARAYNSIPMQRGQETTDTSVQIKY